jgi:Tfp pilus assembly pilus retraction ATPase PilT
MTLQWDRLLETCLTWGGQAIGVAGYPFFLRTDMGFRAFEIPPLASTDLASMFDELVPNDESDERLPGYRSFDLTYGTQHRFRITALGSPSLMSLVLTQLSEGVPPLSNPAFAWPSAGVPVPLEQVIDHCAKSEIRELILVPGCPPLGWSKQGVHALFVPPLGGDDISSMVENVSSSTNWVEDQSGYFGFEPVAEGRYRFRSALFRREGGICAALLRVSDAAA